MATRNSAIVTGASSGIGAATVRALADSGLDVIACARRVDRLESLAKENSAITAHHLDITDQKSVDQLVLDCKNRKVSVLINCAGGAFDGSSVVDSDPEIWRKTYDLNVVGTVRMVKAFAPLMEKRGQGHIVIISSTAGHAAYENGGSYVAAKHGETALARTLRLEFNGLPIRVTEIAPGMVKTEEFAKVRFSGDSERAAKVYEGVKSPLTAEDVAEAIRWSVMLPEHFNVDSMVIRPVAQAAQHKVHRTL
jgi:NADP-dependent 3-hydroxy acid dehydrogenase YdfG